MTLGIAVQKEACIMDRAMLADAGEDVLQYPAFGQMSMHIVDRDERDKEAFGDPGKSRNTLIVIAIIVMFYS